MDKQFIFGVVDNKHGEVAFRSFDDAADLIIYVRGMKGCDIHEIQEDCVEMGDQFYR